MLASLSCFFGHCVILAPTPRFLGYCGVLTSGYPGERVLPHCFSLRGSWLFLAFWIPGDPLGLTNWPSLQEFPGGASLQGQDTWAPFLGVSAQPHKGAVDRQESVTYPSAQSSSSGNHSGSSGRPPGRAPGSQSRSPSPPSWWRAAARAQPQWPSGAPPKGTESLTWWGPGDLAQCLRGTWAMPNQGTDASESTV